MLDAENWKIVLELYKGQALNIVQVILCAMKRSDQAARFKGIQILSVS